MSDALLTDPLGRTFTLASHTWYGHILVGHPEMRPHRALVEQAIVAPICIRLSQSSADCRICYGAGPRSGVFVAVVVDIILRIVRTAYLTRTVTSGRLEWQP